MPLNDAYLAVFDNPAGQRVLKHLESMFGAKDTLEPEELVNKSHEAEGSLLRVHIDPLAMSKRHGLRSAYWKIYAMIENARKEKSSGG
jgi:hypothetical protein